MMEELGLICCVYLSFLLSTSYFRWLLYNSFPDVQCLTILELLYYLCINQVCCYVWNSAFIMEYHVLIGWLWLNSYEACHVHCSFLTMCHTPVWNLDIDSIILQYHDTIVPKFLIISWWSQLFIDNILTFENCLYYQTALLCWSISR